MKRKSIVFLCAALLLAGALAQDAIGTSQPSVEIRLSLVESRLGRLESDVSRLTDVPTQLARIEEKLTALTERTGNNSSVLQTVGLAVFTGLLGGFMGWLFKSKKP